MLDSSINGKEASRRVLCLDFLRGFFVFLALWQHFGFYINYWYVSYYGGWSFWGDLFGPHAEFVGQQIAVDKVSVWAAWFFTPWVSQIYLFLAAFNLAKMNENCDRKIVNQKIALFFGLFLLFTFENFIVAPNVGEAVSLYPLQTWMLLLALVLFSFRYLGEKAIWILFLFGLTKFGLPLDSLFTSAEQFFRNTIHENFEIDARPDYFLSSACLGFLLGREWWVGKGEKLKNWLIAGVIAFVLWYIFGESFTVNPKDVFFTEHDLAKKFIGLIGIHGIEIVIVSAFLYLKKNKYDINLSFFNWIGRYSLLVFFLHRIIFLKIIMPFRMVIYNLFDYPIRGIFIEFWLYVSMIVLAAWIIKKLKILVFLEGR